jgi:large subunit ribosomal protein L25
MELTAQKREPGKTRKLRSQGQIPGIVYNKNVNIPVSIEMRAFDKVFRSQGTSSIIDLNVDGTTHEVLVKAVQMDKRRREPQHVDFYEVTAGQKVEVYVHINLDGTPQGVKDGGLMDVQRREVHISILPRLIPHDVTIDVRELTIGDSLHIRDIVSKLPAEAEVLGELDTTIVAIVPPRLAAEEEEVTEEVEPELIARGKEDEDDEEDE